MIWFESHITIIGTHKNLNKITNWSYLPILNNWGTKKRALCKIQRYKLQIKICVNFMCVLKCFIF